MQYCSSRLRVRKNDAMVHESNVRFTARASFMKVYVFHDEALCSL